MSIQDLKKEERLRLYFYKQWLESSLKFSCGIYELSERFEFRDAVLKHSSKAWQKHVCLPERPDFLKSHVAGEGVADKMKVL